MIKAETEKKLFIMRGISGSGKSFLSEKLQQEYGIKAISADNYFTDPVTKQYNFNPSKIKDAHDKAKSEFAESINRNQRVIIIDNTNTLLSEMRYYVELGKNMDIQ